MALIVGTNSYSSRADADAYFVNTLRAAAWEALSDGTRDAGLIEATTWLETFRWAGTKSDPDQTLAFPRDGLTDRNGTPIPDGTIPPDILKAQWELALQLASGAISSTGDTTSNIRRQKLDVLEQEFFEARRTDKVSTFSTLPSLVRDLIRPYFGDNGAGSVGVFASGTDEKSYLADGDGGFYTPDGLYGRTDGFA